MRKGQVAVYLLMVLVGLFLIALMNVDTFVVVRGKNRTQNAGDAATLAAARKQGNLLNELGRLNLEHIVAAAQNDFASCSEIISRQKRLVLLGPVEALRLANHAAKKNGMEVRSEFEDILREHIREIREVYEGGTNAQGEPYPEPFPGAWPAYATAIEEVVNEGLACGPDNVEFYGAEGGHFLLTQNFYHAIAGKNWCWFHFNAEGLLASYNSYQDWAPLPTRDEDSMENSEIFNLHVRAWQGALTDLFTTNEIQYLCQTYGAGALSEEELTRSEILTNREQTWYLYEGDAGGQGRWGTWFNGLCLAGDDEYEFPIVGEIKPEYNVRGCAAICRCVTEVSSLATETDSRLNWSAAAKPFGTVENFDRETDVVTAFKSFVVPCFTTVRLVPLDAVGGGNLATADYDWVMHVRHHLEAYLRQGLTALKSDCFYCQLLWTWENRVFRDTGLTWIKYNSGSCVRETGSPGGGHGGTAHGH